MPIYDHIISSREEERTECIAEEFNDSHIFCGTGIHSSPPSVENARIETEMIEIRDYPISNDLCFNFGDGF